MTLNAPQNRSAPKVKICGVTESKGLESACAHGADFIGFLFYPPSDHYVEPARAAPLSEAIPGHIKSVGLFVDPTDQDIDQILNSVNLDMIQLHGRETPERVSEVKSRTGLEVIKAIKTNSRADLPQIKGYRDVADWLIFDSGGGSGRTFDWDLLLDYNDPSGKWMLAGGLNNKNVEEAISKLNPPALDISSGVELKHGKKDPDKVRDFLYLVKNPART